MQHNRKLKPKCPVYLCSFNW